MLCYKFFCTYDDRIAFYNKMKIEYSILNIEQLTGLLVYYLLVVVVVLHVVVDFEEIVGYITETMGVSNSPSL